MDERDRLFAALIAAGGDRAALEDREVPHLVALGHAILSTRTVAGLEVAARQTRHGISARVRVCAGVVVPRPVHLCFGIVHPKGTQRIRMDVRLERGASAHFIAHCLFPDARRVRHIMAARIVLAENAEMHYQECHFHGPYGGIEVLPAARVRLARNARYYADFALTTGRVGALALDYAVTAGENSVTELSARVFGRGNDRITIREAVILAGRNARSLIRTRIALEQEASADVTGITEGQAPGARGHVDCMEIVRDRAVARAVPVVAVTDPLAKVTHEAAIGSVDQRQLETLMARGLTAEAAVDLIVKGILQ